MSKSCFRIKMIKYSQHRLLLRCRKAGLVFNISRTNQKNNKVSTVNNNNLTKFNI